MSRVDAGSEWGQAVRLMGTKTPQGATDEDYDKKARLGCGCFQENCTTLVCSALQQIMSLLPLPEDSVDGLP